MRRPSPSPITNPSKPVLPPPALQSEPPFNRFAANFVPAVPAGSSVLAKFALEELVKPVIKLVTPSNAPFVSVSAPEAVYHHSIDDDYHKTASIPAVNSNLSPTRPALADLFSHGILDSPNPVDSGSLSSSTVPVESQGSSELHALDPSELRRNHLYIAEEIVQSCTEAKRVHSQSSSTLLRYDPDWQCPEPLEVSDCSRRPVSIWNSSKTSHTQMLCLVQRFTMCIGDLEPFFCSLAVYDLRQNAGKISENFFFDLNSEDVLTSGLSVWRLAADEVTLCRNAIFTIPDRHPLVLLVLRIERILQGDPEEAFEPYLKEKGRPVNEMDKISKRVRATINRLSDYRQSFGVALIPLFSETGELLSDVSTFATNKIFMEKQACDEVVFLDQLREYYSVLNDHPVSLKKKIIPSTEFALECYILDNQVMPQNRVDPSLIPLKPSDAMLEKQVKGPVREVQYLPLTTDPIALPFDYFVNSLYIYPLHVQFQKYRNIACKVELRLSDTSVDSNGIKTFFGKSSQGAFVSSQTTQVAYHNKSPWMQDEMKLMLPLAMTDSIHLFFTFYHISCQKKVGKPTEEVIGYSLLPLFKGNMLVPDGTYNLAIASKLPDHYISKYEARAEDANISFRMQTAECFQIRIRSLSCLFCTDSNLNKFIANLPSPNSQLDIDDSGCAAYDRCLCLDFLIAASSNSIIQYLPAVMTFLFSVMSQARSVRLQYTCFCALDVVVAHVHHLIDDGSFRSSLITAFIQNRLTNVCSSTRCAEMLQRALHHLESDSSDPQRQLVIRNLWFWLDCLVRLSTLELLRGNFQVHELFSLLVDIFEMLACRMPSHKSSLGVSALRIANSCIALFFTDIFTILDKQLVFMLISHYFESFDAIHDSVLLEFKMRFVEIIFDSTVFPQVAGFQSHAALGINEILARYPLQALLIRFIETYCDFQEKSIRGVLFKSFRKICTKLDRDSTLSLDDRKCLSTSFLPFLQAMGDRVTVVKNMAVRQRRDFDAVLIWIVGSADDQQLSYWISHEDSDVLQGLNQLLCFAIEDFDYIGMVKRSAQNEFDAIISPESSASLFGIEAGEVLALDIKTNIEQMMGTLTRGVAGPGLILPAGRSSASRASPHKSNAALCSTPNGSVRLSLRQKRAQMAAHGSIRRTMDKSSVKFLETVTNIEGVDMTKRICNLESALTESVGASCLRWLVLYITVRWQDDIDQTIKAAKDGLSGPCDRVIQVISALFSTQQPIHVNLAIYPLLRFLLYAYGPIVLQCSTFAELTKRLLAHCASSSVDIRASAASMLYWMAGADLAANRTLNIFLSNVTESLSAMVEIMSNESAQRLSQVFRSVPSSGIHGLEDVINQILKILADTREVARQEGLLSQNTADFALFEDLLLNMAEAYSHLPSIRIQWLQRLADHHNKFSKFAESSQTMLTIASMVIDIYAGKETDPLPDSTLCINRDNIIKRIHDWEINGTMNQVCQSRINLKQLKSDQNDVSFYDRIVKLLLGVCQALDHAQLFERCNYIYRGVLVPIMERHQDFPALSTAYLHLHNVFSQLVSSASTESRLLGSYYRITFLGDPDVFGKEARQGKQYIYKMPKITRLAEVVEYMKASYGQQLKPDQFIRIWPDSGPIDKSRAVETEQIIQVTYVVPYVCNVSCASSFIDRNCDIKKFLFSTPFISGGDYGVSHSSDITKQQKRNMILEVKDPFPSMITRQAVIASQEIIMSPVESATENVTLRTFKLRESVQDKSNIDKKVLSSLLQGSVMLQVHGGTKEIALAFFGPESSLSFLNASSENKKLLHDLEILRQSIFDFVDTCEMCIEVYGSAIRADDKLTPLSEASMNSERILHAEFDKHLRKLREEIFPVIKGTKNKGRRAVRFEGALTKLDAE